MSKPVRIEDGLIVGTTGDKYDSKNPLARWLVDQFDRAVLELAAYAKPSSVLEIGCGEGHVLNLLLQATTAEIHATDISATCLSEAKANIASSDRVSFQVADVMTMEPRIPAPDLVVCCEVLEHLEDPERGLRSLVAQGADWYLLSVPREPLWRILNFSRGRYIPDFGNSPGHLQHWNKRGFLRFVGHYLTPVLVRSPLPWTVVLCRRNGS